MGFSLVLCGRFASGGLTSIAIISSIKIATGIAIGGQCRLVLAANRNKISIKETARDYRVCYREV